MKTHPVLRITETGEVEINLNYPVQPKPEDYGCPSNNSFTSWYVDKRSKAKYYRNAYKKYECAIKESESGFMLVQNKEYAMRFLGLSENISTNPEHTILLDRFIPGIYPYTGEVKIEWQCKSGSEWVECIWEYHTAILDVGQFRKVSILVEKTDAKESNCKWPECKCEHSAIPYRCESRLNEIESLRTANDKLQKFKDYVHDRLDKIGVPENPDPENNAVHGCRIEGRLNYVENEVKASKVFKKIIDAKTELNKKLIAENKELVGALKKAESIFKRLADEGKYPEFMLQQNGGEGFKFISDAITKHS